MFVDANRSGSNYSILLAHQRTRIAQKENLLIAALKGNSDSASRYQSS
jgi:hypothetical protein